MGKRQADKQLTKGEIGSDDSGSELEQQNGENEEVGENTQEEISQRKIIRAKRTVQSNQDNNSNSGKLQLSGGLFTSNVTDADKKEDDKSKGGDSKPLFNFTNQGTSGSLFGGAATSNNSQFNFSFKPATTQAATGATNSVFSGGSLFGGQGLTAPAGGLFGGAVKTGSLFGSSTGGGLFNNPPTLFNNPSGGSLFSVGSAPKKVEDDEDDDDGEEGNEASNSPPAFQIEGATIPGVTDKPIQLKINPIPVQKSPYTKVFSQQVEKFKIVPRAVPAGKEESKGEDSKKVSMGRGYLSLESAEVNNGKVYIVVFRSLIGKTLFQGTVSGTLSKMRRIEEKAIKLQLKLAVLVKEGAKFRTEFVIASFQKSDDLKDFETKFADAVKELKPTKKDE
ncbi:hypothetical protein FGO68_gene12345 [Halteria grandinella]|uniref:Nuclear pore complex NUP2/50/61 domain-containing protein n=1 Tax=Halteria grandinella TaxID=5974 RepID=A0A8J8NMF2_HALGN|nr:hypothetical protein FGO68_gene12345 [Halteria grandinella]